MAKATDKKTVKKADVVQTPAEIRKELDAKRHDLTESRRSHRSGELVNPRILRTTRKEIARLMTKLNATKEEK